MKKLKNRKELLEVVKDLRAVEITARDDYQSNVMTFKNFEIVNTFSEIKSEEDKHIEILNKIIRMIEELEK